VNRQRQLDRPCPKSAGSPTAGLMHGSEEVLLDHCVGAGEQRGGNGEPERLCSGEIDAELETGRQLDRYAAHNRRCGARSGAGPRRRRSARRHPALPSHSRSTAICAPAQAPRSSSCRHRTSHHAILDLRPAEDPVLEPLAKRHRTQAAAVPEHQLDPVRALGAEHVI
jgi:hypothetical protein